MHIIELNISDFDIHACGVYRAMTSSIIPVSFVAKGRYLMNHSLVQ